VPSRKLEIELIGDSSSLSRSFRGAVRDADTFGSRLRHVGVMGAKALGGAVVAGAAAATYGIIKSSQAAEEANKVHAQTGAVLESTRHAANISQKGVEDLSGAISRKTGIDDEQIQTGANLLLTFKEIRNEAGAGNDIFSQSTQTIVDMSTALGSDLKSSAIQVGKALNDPIKGITALQKVGVTFSEQKKEQIAQWVEEGDVLRAQKEILKELNTEFGGSAVAQATALDKVKVSLGNVEESIGNVFLPLIERAADDLNEDLVPQLQHTADGLAAIAARKNIDLGEKLSLGGDVIARDWGDVPEEIGEVIDAAVPIVAERSGQLGIAMVKGTLRGFVNADPLGKAALLLFASKAFGGPAAVLGAGKQMGSRFGGAAATESALAMSTFGFGAAGTKAFGMIDRAKGVGKTVGKAGLAVGLISGVAAGLEDADSVGDHFQNAFSGLTFGFVPAASGSMGDQIADDLMASWDEQLPAVKKHIQGRTLDALSEDRGKLDWVWKVAVDTGASADRLDAIRAKMIQLDRTISGIKNAGQVLDQGIAGLEGGKFTRLGDIEQIVAKNSVAIAERFGEGTQEARDAAARNFRAAADAIEVGMNRGVISTRRGMAEIQRLTRQAHLVSGDDPWGIAKGFQRTWERSGTVTRQSLDRITGDLDRMPPVAAQVTAQMMVGMARQMRSKGQLSKNEVEKLRSAVVTKLDLMARQGGKKGEALELNVGGAFGGLSITTAEALENIGSNVESVMKALGAGKIPKFTLDYLQANGPGGGKGYLDQVPEFKARGGTVTVPGQGLHDTVPLAINGKMSAVVAPGETLAAITCHQLPLLDRAVANEYGVAGMPGFFDTFDTPHFLAKGGFPEPRLAGPDPLRSLGQAGIHRAYKAGQAHIKAHRPKAAPAGIGVELGSGEVDESLRAAIAIGARHGSSVSSLERPGTGGSYHDPAYNPPHQAVDLAGGNMMATAKGILKAFGAARILELFYNPLGFEVNDYRKGPMTVMDHYDHVHAAFARGGVIGRFAGGGIVNWDKLVGPTWDNDELATLAHIVGMPTPGLMARYAQGESSGDPDARNVNTNGSVDEGLWQINSVHGFPGDLTDPLVNAKAARSVLEDQGIGAWYASPAGPRGEVDKALAAKIRGVVAGEDPDAAGPATKQQKHTMGALRHRAAGVVREAQKLKAEYKDYGGTKTGKRALNRTLKFAKEAAAKVKAGDSEAAKDLIDRARDQMGKARDSYEKAAEGVYTPGLKGGQLPELGTKTFDPGRDFSLDNLPDLGVLPPELKKILKAPGLDWAGKYGALETTLSMAGMTDTKVDDAAALNAMLGMDRRKREHLKRQLAELNKKLGKGGLTKKQRESLVAKRNQVLQGLGEVTGNIGSIRDQIGGLNEGGDEAEEREDPAVKAAEEAKQASEELKASLDELNKTIKEQAQRESSEQAITAKEATRAVGDMLAGYLGQKTDHGAHVAAPGRVGTL
jgi:hypothetical protein